MVERKRHFAVDKLSLQARTVIDQMLGDNATYDKICAAVKEKTGEKLAVSSLHRYHANKWFPLRKTLEENERVFGLIKETLERSQGKKFDEVTSEIAKAKLFELVAALKDPDPLALYQVVISQGRLDVERQRIAQSAKRIELEEKKVEILETQLQLKERQIEQSKEKAVAAEKKVEEIGRRKKLDPETMRVIKEEIYGIVETRDQRSEIRDQS